MKADSWKSTAVLFSAIAVLFAVFALTHGRAARLSATVNSRLGSLLQRLRRPARWMVTAMMVGAIALFVGVVALPRLAGAELRTVVSGSMEPTIEPGSVVVAFPVSAEDLEVGDIIIFRRPDNPEQVVTHRITGIDQGPPLAIETGGDANNAPDSWSLSPSAVLGKVAFHVPKLGYLVERVDSLAGFLAFLVVPSLLLVVSEIGAWYRFVRYGGTG
jgi:signal peptidase